MKFGRHLILLSLILWTSCVLGIAQFPGPEEKDQIKPTLVADTSAIEAGKPFTAGVRFEIKDGWYTYWRFVGETGMPLEITWELPPGFNAGPLQWPIPVSHEAAGDFYYIYEHETMLFSEITPPAQLPSGSVTLKAKLMWQVCDPMTCVPGAATVELPLSVGPAQPANAELFTKWRAQIPKTTPPPFQIEWRRDKGEEFAIRIAGLSKDLNAEFFPLPPSKEVKPGNPKLSDVADDGTRTITFPIEEGGAPNLPWEGVIATSKEGASREGWQIAATGKVTLQTTAAPSIRALPGASGSASTSSLPGVLLAAFFGGLILNLMPCVLPVIALKIFGFVRQAGEEPKRVFHLGLAFVAGVFVFFSALAALAVGLRAAGHSFFWGMQFADTRLMIALIALVVLFAMSMFGVFDITLGGRTENTLGTLSGREGYSGAFVHGLFTTLLGTSCTAPYVGSVLGFAVTQPPASIAAIFLTMAAGMSLPYFLLTWHPAWMRFLPKPGAWMERFKQLMGFVLLGVAVWLLGALGTTRGVAAMTATAWFLAVLALAGWIYGVGGRRWWATILALVIAVVGGTIFLGDALKKSVSSGSAAAPTPNKYGILWEPLSESRLAEARRAGRPVFIDFTAEWCANCKANERLVINTERVAAEIKKKGIVTLKGDWTDFDPEITKWLKKFNRVGVPVYVFYPADGGEPVVLSELLTQNRLLTQFGGREP